MKCFVACLLFASAVAKGRVPIDLVELEQQIHALTINPRQGPRGGSDMEADKPACDDTQTYLIAFDAGSSGSTMFMYGQERACTLNLLNGECDGEGNTCGDIDAVTGISESMGKYWGGKNVEEEKNLAGAQDYAAGFMPKESCHGKVCPDFAKFDTAQLKEDWSQPIIRAIEGICGKPSAAECVGKFSFAIGATAGNRIQSADKESDDVDWNLFTEMFAAHPLLKDVKPLKAETLPGTQEASYELQAVPRKDRLYRNYVSCGGASAQVGLGLDDDSAQKFLTYKTYLEEFGSCNPTISPLLCGTEQKSEDFMKVENTAGLGKTGLISFLSGNQESAHSSKPCKTPSNPPSQNPTLPLKTFMKKIAKASEAYAGGDGECELYVKLHEQGYRLHLVGGMDQAFGSDDMTTSDVPVGFGEWAKGFSECKDACFTGQCNATGQAENCKGCIKAFLKWDVQYILAHQSVSDMMAAKDVDHHAYAVAQVFAGWKRAQQAVSNEFKDFSDKYAGTTDIQVRQFKDGGAASVDYGAKPCLNHVRKSYHGQFGVLFTFALAEAMGFGSLEWQKGESAEWIDGLAASYGFKAEYDVTIQTPFKCEPPDEKEPEAKRKHVACPWTCAEKKSCQHSMAECGCQA